MNTIQDKYEQRHRESWIKKGFDPDQPTQEFYGCFTKAEAQASLFQSNRFNHVTVRLTDKDDGIDLPIVIDLARPLYITDDIGPTGSEPNWYFEGWVFEPGQVEVRRVRVHVATMDYDSEFSDDDIFSWQWITPPVEQLPLDATLRKIGFNGRAYTLLSIEGINTINDVIEYARRHDLKELGIGPKSQARLRTKIEEAGHKLP